MSDAEVEAMNIRFKCLKMAIEKVDAPLVIETAREYLNFLHGKINLKAAQLGGLNQAVANPYQAEQSRLNKIC